MAQTKSKRPYKQKHKTFQRQQPKQAAMAGGVFIDYGALPADLDAEAYEAWLYPGATSRPTRGDFVLFRENRGRFVQWNARTGVVMAVLCAAP